MSPTKRLVIISQDKGGQSKSWLAANLFEWLRAAPGSWRLVEVEQRLDFTLQRYWYGKVPVLELGLAEFNPTTQRTDPSLAPLDQLASLAKEDTNIIVDLGASTFSLFSLWLTERRAYKYFLNSGYAITFVVPVCASEPEAADFLNHNYALMAKLGTVLVVRNLRDGAVFPSLDPELAAKALTILRAEPPLSEDFVREGGGRRTLIEIQNDPTLSWRSQTDAEYLWTHLRAQLEHNSSILLPPKPTL